MSYRFQNLTANNCLSPSIYCRCFNCPSVGSNIHDQIVQRQRCEMEKRELERQRKTMEIHETQRKWNDAMVKPEEKDQHNHLLFFHERHQQLRVKALELAIKSCGESVKSTSSINILAVAKTFYTYITKGE